jgi:hypothetical protein
LVVVVVVVVVVVETAELKHRGGVRQQMVVNGEVRAQTAGKIKTADDSKR